MEELHQIPKLRVGYLMQTNAIDLRELSGAQLHVLAIIKGLRKLGHSVRVVAFQGNQLGWSEDLEKWLAPAYGITDGRILRLIESLIRRIQFEFKLPYIGLFDSLRYADACRNHLKGYDVLYERYGYMGFGGLIAARLLGIPIVIELNGNILKEIDERGLSLSTLQRKIGRWLTMHTLRAADHVVVVSKALEQTVVNDYHVPVEKISIVVNGVDIDLFSRKTVDYDARSRFGLASGPIVAFVGTFEPWHGVELLISAFQDVECRYRDAQLVIIGDGPGKEKAVIRATDLGLRNNVRFLGRLPQADVAAVLGTAKVLVAPYPFVHDDIVGTPLKILEYMAAGKGIVVSAAPLHDMIEHEVTGLRVPPANKKVLAQGIICLLENDTLSSYLGHNAFQRVQMYSWDNASRQIGRIFMEEIARKSRVAKTRVNYS